MRLRQEPMNNMSLIPHSNILTRTYKVDILLEIPLQHDLGKICAKMYRIELEQCTQLEDSSHCEFCFSLCCFFLEYSLELKPSRVVVSCCACAKCKPHCTRRQMTQTISYSDTVLRRGLRIALSFLPRCEMISKCVEVHTAEIRDPNMDLGPQFSLTSFVLYPYSAEYA